MTKKNLFKDYLIAFYKWYFIVKQLRFKINEIVNYNL